MRLILQDRRSVVRHAASGVLHEHGIAVVGTVCSDDELRHACAHDTPDAVLIELDVADWDVASLADDLRRHHPPLRVVGLGRAGVARADMLVDACVPISAPLTALVSALRGDAVVPPHRTVRDTVPSLTVRQTEILSLISQGRSAEQIAVELRVSTSTVSHHKREIFTRLGARSQAQAVVTALRHGLLETTGP